MAPLPRTFPETRAALEQALAKGEAGEAERLVARLQEKARTTRSREQDALAWFARGILEDGTGRRAAAEQSLLVAVNIGRDLFRERNDALGHAARSLGFVYAHLDRPDSASEMFLLARNVFLKTQPELAPEVVRLAASCNIALRLPEQALAIVHQELGAPESRTTPRSADQLDLYLLRGRAFEEQHKPTQALKAWARVTQLLTAEPHARAVVAQAWILIAQAWARCGDKTAAARALHCAALVDGGRGGASQAAIDDAATALGVSRFASELTPAWQVQRVVDRAVALASPARGLFFELASQQLQQSAVVGAQHLPDGSWALRRPLKLICGRRDRWSSQNMAARGDTLRGQLEGPPFEVGEVVHLDDGLSEPSERRVLNVWRRKVVVESAPDTGERNPLAAQVPSWMGGLLVGTVWAPGEESRPVLNGDEVIHQLLRGGA